MTNANARRAAFVIRHSAFSIQTVSKSTKSLMRIAVSATLIAILLYVAKQQHVWEKIRQVPPGCIAAATGLLTVGWLINSQRWGLLLRAAGVRENPIYLAALYFIGMFFSQMLPTGAGGDAVRMWNISRRHGSPAAAVVATLQERLLGMGVSMVIGLIAAAMYFDRLPPASRLPLLGVPLMAVVAVAIFLYPRVPISIGRAMWRRFGPRSIDEKGILAKIQNGVSRAATQASELPPLRPGRLIPIVLVTLFGVLFSISVWWELGRGVGPVLPYSVYCLIVPLVWIISMAPSLGGAGVREGGFVFLMKLFDVPTDRALTIAALYLIVQLLLACVGGLVLLIFVWTGHWSRRPRSGDLTTAEAGHK